jgi:hypothetical protein
MLALIRPRKGKERRNEPNPTDHIKGLKHLSLITRSIPIKRKSAILFTLILLRKRHASTNGHLGTHNPIPSKEGRREDVHRPSLPVGHAVLSAEEFAYDAFDRAAPHDCEWVAAVGGYDPVGGEDAVFQAY